MSQSIAKQLLWGAIVVAIFVAMIRAQSPQREQDSQPTTKLEPLVLRRTVVPVLAIASDNGPVVPAPLLATNSPDDVEDQTNQVATKTCEGGQNLVSGPNLHNSYQPLTLTETDNRSAGPRAIESKPQTHEIIDGDTLERISRRHYGQIGFAEFLFDHNRDVLIRPDVLPLGAIIEIPQRDL